MAALRFTERPTEVPDIRRLISKRKVQIADLENLLSNRMPADLRKITVQRLAGTRANLKSWETYLRSIS